MCSVIPKGRNRRYPGGVKSHLQQPKWFHTADQKSRPKIASMNKKLTTAIAILTLESSALIVVTLWSLLAILQGNTFSLTSSFFLLGLLAAASLWAGNITYGLLKRKRWSHTAAMVLQLLIASIATASFSGEFASPVIGWSLLIPAALGFYLLFSKSVRLEFGKD